MLHILAGERAIGLTFPIDAIGWLDFETKGRLPIDVGAYRYAREADGLILAFAIGNEEPETVVGRGGGRLDMIDLPTRLLAHHARVMAGNGIWCAWNAGFDRAIWNYSCDGFPLMEPHHIIDAMAQATVSGLAPDLAMASVQCGGPRKLETGKKLIELFCLPDSTATPQSHPVEWMAFCAYAGGDIAAMRHIFRCTRQLSIAEWREYWAMEAVNDRGVTVDLTLATRASVLAAEDKRRSAIELRQLSGGAVTTVDQVKRITDWLMAVLPVEGREILTKRQEEVDDDGELVKPAKLSLTRRRVERLIALCHNKPELATALRILQIRLYGGSKTPAKFTRLVQQSVDGMLYGQYVFNGAPQTGRASSKGVQVHNLIRDVLPYEVDAIDAIAGGCSYDELARLGNDDPVSRKLSLLIRPTFVPGEGRVFVWSDWSQIEARILPWLAGGRGAERRLDIFRAVDIDPRVPDLYTRTAADISHLPIGEVTKALRQRGKVAELALGFGGGVGALHAMGAGYGLFLSDDEAKTIVDRWRASNQWCVAFWGRHDIEGSYGLWGAANRAMEQPGVPQQVGRILFIYLQEYFNGSLFCLLPSGRFLIYRSIRYDRVEDLDEDDKPTGRFSTHLRYSRGYGRSKLWHGTFCENVVQATAADFLRGTIRRIEEETWLTTRLHTHDEILLEAEPDDAEAAAHELRAIMLFGFEWSKGLPLMSEETIAYYYTKHEGSHGL